MFLLKSLTLFSIRLPYLSIISLHVGFLLKRHGTVIPLTRSLAPHYLSQIVVLIDYCAEICTLLQRSVHEQEARAYKVIVCARLLVVFHCFHVIHR